MGVGSRVGGWMSGGTLSRLLAPERACLAVSACIGRGRGNAFELLAVPVPDEDEQMSRGGSCQTQKRPPTAPPRHETRSAAACTSPQRVSNIQVKPQARRQRRTALSTANAAGFQHQSDGLMPNQPNATTDTRRRCCPRIFRVATLSPPGTSASHTTTSSTFTSNMTRLDTVQWNDWV